MNDCISLSLLDEDANRITLERAKIAELEEEKKKFALEHIPNESLSVGQHHEVVFYL